MPCRPPAELFLVSYSRKRVAIFCMLRSSLAIFQFVSCLKNRITIGTVLGRIQESSFCRKPYLTSDSESNTFFCRTKTSANKILYFSKECRMTFLVYIHEQRKMIKRTGKEEMLRKKKHVTRE